MPDRKFKWIISLDLQTKCAALLNLHAGKVTTSTIPDGPVARRAFVIVETNDTLRGLCTAGDTRPVVCADWVSREDDKILQELSCACPELARRKVLDVEFDLPPIDGPERTRAIKAAAQIEWPDLQVTDATAHCLLGLALSARYGLALGGCKLPDTNWRPSRWSRGDTNWVQP